MSDDIASWLRSAADEIALPEADVRDVLTGGRRRRLQRGILGLATACVLGAGAWISASLISSDSSYRPPDPVGSPQGGDRSVTGLVPVVMTEPTPGPDVAAAEDIDKARAVTVGFHALLFNVGYELDYRDVERTGDSSWRLYFNDDLEPEYLQGAIQGRRGAADDSIGAMERARERVKRFTEAMREAVRQRDESQLRVLRRKRDAALETVRIERGNIRALQRGIRRLQREIAELERTGGPHPVEVAVELRGREMVVTSVSAPNGPAKLQQAVGYAETVSEIDAWGYDFYDARFDIGRGPRDESDFVANYFWTGPIPSSYEEKCLVQLLDEDGEVIWEQRDIHDDWQGTPPSEDRRDGGQMAITGLSEVAEAGSARFVCEARA